MLTILERVIEPAYHLSQMGKQGFRNNGPPVILTHLQRLYGQPSIGEIDTALLHLNDTMDRNQPIEVILRAKEEV